MKNKASIICVGAQKSGTTTLHDILKQHPDISLPDIKETKFFQRNTEFNKGIDFYSNFFDLNKKHLIEVDPEYMFLDYVPKRIFDTLGPNTRIIFLLRNPVDRAFSHYLMSKRRGFENLKFDKAILDEKDRLLIDDSQADFYKSKTVNFSYISRGYYAKQINNFLKYFNINNMMFVLFEEDFVKNRNETVLKILDFIGANKKIELDTNFISNPATSYKNKHITNFLNRPNFFKKLFKYVLPKKIRSIIREKILSINYSSKILEKLTDKERRYYLDTYFSNDIIELEKIIKRKTNWLIYKKL